MPPPKKSSKPSSGKEEVPEGKKKGKDAPSSAEASKKDKQGGGVGKGGKDYDKKIKDSQHKDAAPDPNVPQKPRWTGKSPITQLVRTSIHYMKPAMTSTRYFSMCMHSESSFGLLLFSC